MDLSSVCETGSLGCSEQSCCRDVEAVGLSLLMAEGTSSELLLWGSAVVNYRCESLSLPRAKEASSPFTWFSPALSHPIVPGHNIVKA